MKIKELKRIISDIPEDYDDLDVWIDTDAYEGGKPVDDVQIRHAADCDLDGDEFQGNEFLYEDEILEKFGLEEMPVEDSFEFTKLIMTLNNDHYRYDGDFRFSKKILAIKF